MTSLDFLYIALGGGFVLLVIFLCVMLLNLTLILRDVSKVTANFRGISEKIYDSVLDPLKTISELTVGFGIVHELIERFRARFGDGDAECDGEDCDGDCEEKNCPEKKNKNNDGEKKKGFFSVKRLRK